MPRILLQRAEEIFPARRVIMNYINSEKVLMGPYGEIYPASHDVNQSMNIKAEEVSDSQEEVDPLEITIQEIKAEPEDCTNSENILVAPYVEIYPTPDNANHAVYMKAEALSYAEEEEDPVAITFPELKAEPEDNLNELQPVHGEEQRYPCDECGHSFSEEQILIAHRCIHSGERPFCCTLCNKSFRLKRILKSHQHIHSGQRPFCCTLCNKSFSRKSNLKSHQRLHSGEKPFCCNICNKSFSVQSRLKTHQRIHSGEKPFCCDVCNKS
ncbi:gastrula zinc finger protein XlCGF7.1-like, partial [Cryptotermes secundus]|uniref:gastrula zinc finger protein XlCGF7.1-like n=1 Tax=Cryptotermes secundus TaxID=105785 RepID=UPI001454BFC2